MRLKCVKDAPSLARDPFSVPGSSFIQKAYELPSFYDHLWRKVHFPGHRCRWPLPGGIELMQQVGLPEGFEGRAKTVLRSYRPRRPSSSTDLDIGKQNVCPFLHRDSSRCSLSTHAARFMPERAQSSEISPSTSLTTRSASSSIEGSWVTMTSAPPLRRRLISLTVARPLR